jgi:trehalose 6-phosphate phosphatase
VTPLADLGGRPLLIVCDYDGTLAPIVRRPEDAAPQPGARDALAALLAHPTHRVAALSGRRAHEVQALLNLPELMVIGLHGMEWPGEPLPAPDTETLRRLARQIPTVPGVRLEDKGWTLAVHFREVEPEAQADVEAALRLVDVPEGWEVVEGKKVREFRPGGFGKGRAVQRLAALFPQHLPVFFGDDVTDEEAFASLRKERGVTVKVGEGDTTAEHRVPDPGAVVSLLRQWTTRPS